MTSLTKEHPQVHAFLEAGGFLVQMSSDNAFGRIPVDQTTEETINKDERIQSEPWCNQGILGATTEFRATQGQHMQIR